MAPEIRLCVGRILPVARDRSPARSEAGKARQAGSGSTLRACVHGLRTVNRGWSSSVSRSQRRDRRPSRPSIRRRVSQVSPSRPKAIVMLISSKTADLAATLRATELGFESQRWIAGPFRRRFGTAPFIRRTHKRFRDGGHVFATFAQTLPSRCRSRPPEASNRRLWRESTASRWRSRSMRCTSGRGSAIESLATSLAASTGLS